MGLIESEWAQKTLNIFKIILYELKIGEPKWAEKSLNELRWALMSSNLNKILPVMHISIRHDICYDF